jgi:hypothetical protein
MSRVAKLSQEVNTQNNTPKDNRHPNSSAATSEPVKRQKIQVQPTITSHTRQTEVSKAHNEVCNVLPMI